MIPSFPFHCIATRHLGGTLTIDFTTDLHEADEAFIHRCRYFNREIPRQPGEYKIEGKYIPETFDTDGWAEIVTCRALAVGR